MSYFLCRFHEGVLSGVKEFSALCAAVWFEASWICIFRGIWRGLLGKASYRMTKLPQGIRRIFLLLCTLSEVLPDLGRILLPLVAVFLELGSRWCSSGCLGLWQDWSSAFLNIQCLVWWEELAKEFERVDQTLPVCLKNNKEERACKIDNVQKGFSGRSWWCLKGAFVFCRILCQTPPTPRQ